MTKLRHSPEGYLRSIQISQNEIFAFCEGKRNDPFFYNALVESVASDVGLEYRVEKIENIWSSGGKISVYEAHKYLKENNLLSGAFKGKKYVCIFFLDKDADTISLPEGGEGNVVYTSLYDVEAHLYYDSNLKAALATALSVPPKKIPTEFSDQRAWCERIAVLWKEWLWLCTYSQVHKVNCGCGYSVSSKINGDNFIENTDIIRFEAFKKALMGKRGLTDEEFSTDFSKIVSLLEEDESKKKLFYSFKGKWIPPIAQSCLEVLDRSGDGDFLSFPSRLASAALAILNFNDPWADYYKERIRNIIYACYGPASPRVEN